MGDIVPKKRVFGPAERRTLIGLKAICDLNGLPDDGGRFIDKVGSITIGHDHGHPGCVDYRKMFPKESP